jgi:hypothetical protein
VKREQVEEFEKLQVQLDGLHQEMSIFAKKSPNEPVNGFKLKFVNATIGRCNELFGDGYRPYADFQSFSVDELPTNSDVTLIMSQYIKAAEQFRSEHIANPGYNIWGNIILGKPDR